VPCHVRNCHSAGVVILSPFAADLDFEAAGFKRDASLRDPPVGMRGAAFVCHVFR